MGRLKHLDGWRGSAILCVLFAHFVTTFGINLGRFGVELFFVLSGRLMAEILFVKREGIGTFFIRRFSRIYPALFVFCTAIYFINIESIDSVDVYQYLSCLTLTENYAQLWIGRNVNLDHIWSLCVEEHVYIFLGFVAYLRSKFDFSVLKVLVVFAACAIMSGFFYTVMGSGYNAVYWRSDVRGASILLGAIAYLSLGNGRFDKFNLKYVPSFGFLIAAICNLNPVPDPIKYSLGTTVLAFSLAVAGVQRNNSLKSLMGSAFLGQFGMWSYSLYLWQQPFAALKGPAIYKIGSGIAAFIVAMISFYAIEKPARRALNRFLSHSEVPPSRW